MSFYETGLQRLASPPLAVQITESAFPNAIGRNVESQYQVELYSVGKFLSTSLAVIDPS